MLAYCVMVKCVYCANSAVIFAYYVVMVTCAHALDLHRDRDVWMLFKFAIACMRVILRASTGVFDAVTRRNAYWLVE
jgi:hypothetical protein